MRLHRGDRKLAASRSGAVGPDGRAGTACRGHAASRRPVRQRPGRHSRPHPRPACRHPAGDLAGLRTGRRSGEGRRTEHRPAGRGVARGRWAAASSARRGPSGRARRHSRGGRGTDRPALFAVRAALGKDVLKAGVARTPCTCGCATSARSTPPSTRLRLFRLDLAATPITANEIVAAAPPVPAGSTHIEELAWNPGGPLPRAPNSCSVSPTTTAPVG